MAAAAAAASRGPPPPKHCKSAFEISSAPDDNSKLEVAAANARPKVEQGAAAERMGRRKVRGPWGRVWGNAERRGRWVCRRAVRARMARQLGRDAGRRDAAALSRDLDPGDVRGPPPPPRVCTAACVPRTPSAVAATATTPADAVRRARNSSIPEIAAASVTFTGPLSTPCIGPPATTLGGRSFRRCAALAGWNRVKFSTAIWSPSTSCGWHCKLQLPDQQSLQKR